MRAGEPVLDAVAEEKGWGVRMRSLSREFADLQQRLIPEFKQGDSVHTLAKRHRVTVQTVERLIRTFMIDGPRGGKR